MRCAIKFLTVLFLVGMCPLVARAQEEADGEDKVVRVDDIIAAIKDNHAAADELYVGKRLQIRGTAGAIERFRSGGEEAEVQYLLHLQGERSPHNYGGGTQPFINCVFDIKQRRGLAEIKRGDMVVIEAKFYEDTEQGAKQQFSFRECKVIRIFPSNSPLATDATPPVGPGAPTAPSVGPTPFGPAPAFPPMAVPDRPR